MHEHFTGAVECLHKLRIKTSFLMISNVNTGLKFNELKMNLQHSQRSINLYFIAN